MLLLFFNYIAKYIYCGKGAKYRSANQSKYVRYRGRLMCLGLISPSTTWWHFLDRIIKYMLFVVINSFCNFKTFAFVLRRYFKS